LELFRSGASGRVLPVISGGRAGKETLLQASLKANKDAQERYKAL
jgi:xylose isomerase